MKNCLYLLMILFIPSIFSCKKEERKEITFISNAVQQAAKENKLLIIEFWAPSCGPCIKLKRDIFDNENNKEFLNEYFILKKVSPADSIYKALFKYFHCVYQSTVIFIDRKGNEIDRTIAYDGERESYLNFLKDVTESKNLYKDVVEAYHKDSLNAKNNFLLANKLLFRYQNKDAIKYYNKVLIFDKDDKLGFHAVCNFRIAENEIMKDGKTDLMQDYVKKYSKGDFLAKAYTYLISDLLNKKDSDKCLAMCSEAYKKFPDNSEILNKYAWTIYAFKVKKDYVKALSMIQKAIMLNPNFSNYYSTQSWLFFETGGKEKAIESVKKAIELNPHPAYKADLEKFQAN